MQIFIQFIFTALLTRHILSSDKTNTHENVLSCCATAPVMKIFTSLITAIKSMNVI